MMSRAEVVDVQNDEIPFLMEKRNFSDEGREQIPSEGIVIFSILSLIRETKFMFQKKFRMLSCLCPLSADVLIELSLEK